MNKNSNKISLLTGITITFEYDNHLIKSWFSAISGLEKVFVDDVLVATNRSYSLNSTNSFLINGIPFSIISKSNLFMKPIIFTLLENNIPIKKQILNFSINKKMCFLLSLLYLMITVVFTEITLSLKLSSWYECAFFALMFISIFALHNKIFNVTIKKDVCIKNINKTINQT